MKDSRNVAIFFKSNEYNDEESVIKKRNLKKFVKANKIWNLIGIYSEFKNMKNNNKNRKNLTKVLDDIFKENISLIVIDSFSSIITKEIYLKEFLEFFYEIQVDLFFVKEKYNTHKNSVDEQREKILFNKRKNAISVEKGIIENILNGKKFNLPSCLGYIFDPNINNYVINEEQAKTVRLIFELYLKGNYTINKIAQKLHNDKILNFNNKTTWGADTIVRIITNEKYAGDVLYGKDRRKGGIKYNSDDEKNQMYFKNHHVAIIDRETFDKVQEKYNENRNKILKNREKCNGNFTGKLYCGWCGRAVNIIHEKTGTATNCITYSTRLRYTASCQSKKIPESILKDVCVLAINALIEKREKLESFFNENKFSYMNCLLKKQNVLDDFNKEIFDKFIKYIIIGKKSKGKLEPYTLRFVLKNNTDYFVKNDERYLNIFKYKYHKIIDFDSEQYIFNFKKFDDRRRLCIEDKIRIIICYESEIKNGN